MDHRLVLVHRGQQFIQRHGGEAGGVIAHRVGDDEFASVQQRAARVHNIRDITFALSFIRGEQRFPQPPDHARGVGEIEQECAEAIFPHGADAVAQYQNRSCPS